MTRKDGITSVVGSDDCIQKAEEATHRREIGSPRLNLILTSTEDDQECHIWYPDTPSTTGGTKTDSDGFFPEGYFSSLREKEEVNAEQASLELELDKLMEAVMQTDEKKQLSNPRHNENLGISGNEPKPQNSKHRKKKALSKMAHFLKRKDSCKRA